MSERDDTPADSEPGTHTRTSAQQQELERETERRSVPPPVEQVGNPSLPIAHQARPPDDELRSIPRRLVFPAPPAVKLAPPPMTKSLLSGGATSLLRSRSIDAQPTPRAASLADAAPDSARVLPLVRRSIPRSPPFPTVPLHKPAAPSVAPVSIPSAELEQIPAPPPRKARILYTILLAAAFGGALYVYQAGRRPAEVPRATPALQSPIAEIFKTDSAQSPQQSAPAALGARPELPAPVLARAALAKQPASQPAQATRLPRRPDKTSQSPATRTAPADSVQPEPEESEPESLPPFDSAAAQAALAELASTAAGCLADGEPIRTVTVSVTFAPSGQPTAAWVEGAPYAGTPRGSCLAAMFRTARVSPFSGHLVTVRKTMILP